MYQFFEIRIEYIHTYISLFKVDKNHNSLLTNKHRLKLNLKKLQSYKLYISYIGDNSFTKVARAIVAAP